MNRIVDALDGLPADEIDILWHIQFHINHALCLHDAGSFDSAIKSIARAAHMSRPNEKDIKTTTTANTALTITKSDDKSRAGRSSSATSAAAATTAVTSTTAASANAGSTSHLTGWNSLTTRTAIRT